VNPKKGSFRNVEHAIVIYVKIVACLTIGWVLLIRSVNHALKNGMDERTIINVNTVRVFSIGQFMGMIN
jgi:hypothetical protein